MKKHLSNFLNFLNQKKVFEIVYWTIGIGLLFFICYQYIFLTNFPIGDDPGHHITSAIGIENSHFSLSYLKTLLYPIPLLIFALVHKITGIDWPNLFIITICTYLFIASLALAYFTTRGFKNMFIGIPVALVFASSKWISDALRTGLFAEAWAWFVFILVSNFLVSRRFWWLLVFTIILALSHPLSLSIFILTAFLYSIMIVVFNPQKQNSIFFLKFWLSIIVIFIFTYLFLPGKINSLVSLYGITYLSGARSLKEIALDSSHLRMLIYFVSIIGLIGSVSYYKKRIVSYFWALLFVSVLIIQSFYWGVKLMVFRFYPYFEIAIAVFAGFGIYYIFKILSGGIKNLAIKKLVYLFILVFTVILIIPNIKVNRAITRWQINDKTVMATMENSDKETILWAKDNLDNSKIALSYVKWGSWIYPLSNIRTVESDSILTETNPILLSKKIHAHSITYIFLPSWVKEHIIDNLPERFILIYKNENSRIYKIP